ncbi:hypothetical protein BsWGS_17035 [Bradybaena similaris]
MQLFRVRLKPKRICDILIVLGILGNVAYIIRYRVFSGGEETDSSDERVRAVDSHQQSDEGRVFTKRDDPKHEEPPRPADGVSVFTKRGDPTHDETPHLTDGVGQKNGADILQPCPENPPFLVGQLACDCGAVKLEQLVSSYTNIEPGGRLRPPTCRPAQRTAVIIPFRDRHQHLYTLLGMLIPILQRQQTDVTFFVIEQTSEAQFNRAALQNIGFLEALKTTQFDCFIFQDVDLIPLNDRNLYRCGPQPKRFIANIRMGQKVQHMYQNYMGGVIAFTRDQYQTINGNSNLYFGWGGEDDELHQRIGNKNWTRILPEEDVGLYIMLDHERQETKHQNDQRFEILKSVNQRQDIEGLNTSKYKVNSIKRDQLFTWINVSLNVTQVLLTAPENVRRDITNFLKSRRKS